MNGTRFKDLIGQRFGHLVAIQSLPERRQGRVVWVCRCDCGAITHALGIALRAHDIRSCGCRRAAPRLQLGRVTRYAKLARGRSKSAQTSIAKAAVQRIEAALRDKKVAED
jgi:hypothetical protein